MSEKVNIANIRGKRRKETNIKKCLMTEDPIMTPSLARSAWGLNQ